MTHQYQINTYCISDNGMGVMSSLRGGLDCLSAFLFCFVLSQTQRNICHQPCWKLVLQLVVHNHTASHVQLDHDNSKVR